MKDSTKESISLLNRIIPNSIPGSSEIRNRFTRNSELLEASTYRVNRDMTGREGAASEQWSETLNRSDNTNKNNKPQRDSTETRDRDREREPSNFYCVENP